jgi:hypothetical protein
MMAFEHPPSSSSPSTYPNVNALFGAADDEVVSHSFDEECNAHPSTTQQSNANALLDAAYYSHSNYNYNYNTYNHNDNDDMSSISGGCDFILDKDKDIKPTGSQNTTNPSNGNAAPARQRRGSITDRLKSGLNLRCKTRRSKSSQCLMNRGGGGIIQEDDSDGKNGRRHSGNKLKHHSVYELTRRRCSLGSHFHPRAATGAGGDLNNNNNNNGRRRTSFSKAVDKLTRRWSLKKVGAGTDNATTTLLAADSCLMTYIDDCAWDELEIYLSTDAGERDLCNVLGLETTTNTTTTTARNHHNHKTTEEVANTNTNTTNRRMNVTTERCTFLEKVCTLDPSLFLVTHIAALKPELLLQKNFKKQSHLHIAAAFGANSQVMQFLLDEAPVFATHVDYRGRTPLHLACQCGLELMLQRHGSTDGVDHFMRVIQALYHTNPQAVHCLDGDFRTPLQYAMTATATQQQQQQHHLQTDTNNNDNTDKISSNHNHSSSIVEELKRQQAEERTMQV